MNTVPSHTFSGVQCGLFRCWRFAWAVIGLAWASAAFAGQVSLSSYAFSTLDRPVITTDEPMPLTYKLRAKIMGVPGYPEGFHAATAWQNNGYQLDLLPLSPGSWTVALYWLKYDDAGTTLLEVGPMRLMPINISGGSVDLSSYSFSRQNPATISTASPMPARYRLFAHFADGSPGGFDAATAWNNNGTALDQLPPVDGTYTVTMYWIKYDGTGTAVTESGPSRQVQVTIANQFNVLNASGHIDGYDEYDENGEFTGVSYTSDTYLFPVPSNGQLTFGATGNIDTNASLMNPAGQWLGSWDDGGGGQNFLGTLAVSPGTHQLWVGANSDGDYQVFAQLDVPVLTGNPPVITSAPTAEGTPGAAFSYTIQATNTPTAFRAVGLPAGLSVNSATGVISGSPTLGGGTYFVMLRAANATGGFGPSYMLTLGLAKGTQSISFAALPNKTFGDPAFSLAATATSGLPVTYSVISGPAQIVNNSTVVLTGNGAVIIRAAQSGNSNYLEASAVDRSFVVGALTPIRLGLRYWQAGDYPGIQTIEGQWVWVEATGGGWSYEITGTGSSEDWANWDGSMQDLTDPDGNNQGQLPSPYSVSWNWGDGTPAHSEYQEVTVSHDDGLSGSSWTTNTGAFPTTSTASDYATATTYRGHVGLPYIINDRVTFRVAGLAPGGNCSTYQANLYGPSGASLATRTFANGATADVTFFPSSNGLYRVEISYSGATGVIPANGTVTYYIPVGVTPTAILTNPGPATQSAIRGTNVNFSVSATGSGLAYQWRKDGTPLAGATNAILALTNVLPATAGIYTVQVTGTGGTVVSSGATLTVAPPPPTITSALTFVSIPGVAFTYTIAGTESPTTFGATGLPSGVSLNPATGALEGTVSAAGTYLITLSATNATGTGNATLTLIVSSQADATPPTAPVNLAFLEKNAKTITVVWGAATDNVGVARYEVVRSVGGVASSAGFTSDLAFIDTGRTPNTTYIYTVVAFDAAGNASPASAPLTVTTPPSESLDTDGDGIPNAIQSALGAAPNAQPSNSIQQIIHRPTP